MRLCFCVTAVMAVLLLSPPANAEKSTEKLKRGLFGFDICLYM